MATPRLAKTVLTAADGGSLRVDERSGGRPGERRPAVVICHGFKGFKDWGFFPKLAERLATAGFVAISFNFSGSGVGDGDQFDEPDRWAHQKVTADLADLETVVEHARQLGSGWVGLVGHSRGGGLAVLHAGSDPRISSLVTWAAIDHFLRFPPEAIDQWRKTGKLDVVNARTGQTLPILRDALDDIEMNRDRVDILAAAARVRCPWLIAHGDADQSVTLDVGQRLLAAASQDTARMLVLAGAGHTYGIGHPWKGSAPEFDALMDATVRHLAASLA